LSSDRSNNIVIQAHKLTKTYDEVKVLDGISFEVVRGEIFIVIGPSGAGKTTLLRLIDLLEYPSKGKLIFNGLDVVRLTSKKRFELRRKIGMVFQSTVLFEGTVYSNVSYGLRVRDIPKEEEERKVEKALQTVGLKGFSERYAKDLSGGEAQRVAIARVLAYEPELMLLDEPTANLDPTNTSIIEKTIIKAKSNYKATIIIATHNMFQARRLGDRIALLFDRKFVEVSDPETMFSKPKEPLTKAFIQGELVY
jgi:tungstate transport system ATP-binding protein